MDFTTPYARARSKERWAVAKRIASHMEIGKKEAWVWINKWQRAGINITSLTVGNKEEVAKARKLMSKLIECPRTRCKHDYADQCSFYGCYVFLHTNGTCFDNFKNGIVTKHCPWENRTNLTCPIHHNGAFMGQTDKLENSSVELENINDIMLLKEHELNTLKITQTHTLEMERCRRHHESENNKRELHQQELLTIRHRNKMICIFGCIVGSFATISFTICYLFGA